MDANVAAAEKKQEPAETVSGDLVAEHVHHQLKGVVSKCSSLK
jgi:hypothetical protein